VKLLTAAAVLAVVLVGCAPRPGPYLSCEDVPTADCAAAHEAARSNGLFLRDGEQVTAALVRPTEFRFCNGGDEPYLDVAFTLAGRRSPIVVSVARAESGALSVCTY
jgi:hypothetical protein